MEINLNDWLGQHLVVLWLVSALLMVALEWVRRDRTFAYLGIGAATAGVSSLLYPHWWFGLAVLLVVGGAGIVWNPMSARAAQR